MHSPSTIAIDRRSLARQETSLAQEARACCLVVYSGEQAGRVLSLEQGTNLLGRSVEVSLQIDSPGVSRRHAELRVDGQQVTLRDLGSANGSFRNDQPVQQPVLLDDGDLVRLGSVVLKFYRQRSLDAALHDRLYRLAMVDEGTGVFNRRYFLDAVRRAFALARDRHQPLALVGLDLDRFKQVNDSFGHAAGDEVLKACATTVQAQLPPQGLLARLGGEEFIVLLPGLELGAARAVAERLRQAVAAQTFALRPLRADLGAAAPAGPQPYQQTVSLGVAELTDDIQSPQELMALADQHLYTAKQNGRNRVCG